MTTGWLAIAGIIVVLAASVYTGLGASTSGNAQGDVLATATADAADPVEIVVLTPTPSPSPSPTPTATPDPDNRLDCDKIRGTDYRSTEERTWFLDHCVTN